MAARKWTISQRAKQAELIKKWKPWQHSTGAKTAEGKARSSQNAYKGSLMQKLKHLRVQLNGLIREQRKIFDKL